MQQLRIGRILHGIPRNGILLADKPSETAPYPIRHLSQGLSEGFSDGK